jgi:5-methylcytosine-specific restriction endonuclease McrBC regulatory subunit McrC
MASKIELKDFSKSQKTFTKALYDKIPQNGSLVLDTSICEVVGNKNEIEPILEIRRVNDNNEVEITTFGYVGRFTYESIEFDITYRFGEALLDRMIGFVNDFDIKTVEFLSKNSKDESDNLALKILYLNFILKLEKLSVIGLPKSYERIEHHDRKLKGQIDINRFIKKDIPFEGKISSTSYEQVYVQEMVDLLHSALSIVEKSMRNLVISRVLRFKNLLFEYANYRVIDSYTIDKALNHKSIQNSLFKEFKPILEIASYIVRYENSQSFDKNNIQNGLVIDVSLLWEEYLYRLLQNAFGNEWQVEHEPNLKVYTNLFYERSMKPDIVMKNDEKMIIFDAKSKSMKFKGRDQYGAGDLDRSDFFQIHTYISYYKNMNYNVIAGGLLYPMDSKIDTTKTHSKGLFGIDEKTKFIVDGIESCHDKMCFRGILCRERRFVKRIKEVIQQ